MTKQLAYKQEPVKPNSQTMRGSSSHCKHAYINVSELVRPTKEVVWQPLTKESDKDAKWLKCENIYRNCFCSRKYVGINQGSQTQCPQDYSKNSTTRKWGPSKKKSFFLYFFLNNTCIYIDLNMTMSIKSFYFTHWESLFWHQLYC